MQLGRIFATVNFLFGNTLQGRSQDFRLGGANLVKGPCLGYPQTKNFSVLANYFWERHEFTYKNKIKIKN